MPANDLHNDKKFLHFIEKVKSSQTSQTGKTIHDLNKITKPFYRKIISLIDGFNRKLELEFEDINSPQFKIISNIEYQQAELNRNYIQIIYQEKPSDYNPLTSPSFFIEFEISGSSRFIASTHKKQIVIAKFDDSYNKAEEMFSRFYTAFEEFLELL